MNMHKFNVHYGEETKSLKMESNTPVDDIKRAAFALFNQVEFNDHNAILLVLDQENRQVLLSVVPESTKSGIYLDLWIKVIQPGCMMCSGSFGILSDQLLYECSTRTCLGQYCQKCVTSIRGPSSEYPFTCLSCRKKVSPSRNTLIEEHLIWSALARQYGTDRLKGFREGLNLLSCDSILKDMNFRRIHLRSRLETFQRNLRVELPMAPTCKKLINDVENFLGEIRFNYDSMKEIQEAMMNPYIDLDDMAKEHERLTADFDNLCNRLKSSIMNHQVMQNDPTMKTYRRDEEEIYMSYRMNRLSALSREENAKNVHQWLKDFRQRKEWLDFLMNTIKRLGIVDETSSAAAKTKLDALNTWIESLNYLLNQLLSIQYYSDEYLRLLLDDRQPDICGSRFIYFLETLQIENDHLEIKRSFPDTIEQINQWQAHYGTEEQFKPKVIDLCRSIKEDLLGILPNRKSIYSVPYRIGVIGRTSVGKSALIMKLADLTDYSSMINFERSTFGYLQFDVYIAEPSTGRSIPVSFIDIAGTTDENTVQSSGNYLNLMLNTDCDVYMLVFDKPFDRLNQNWQNFIVNDFQRKCLLVRSKCDETFDESYREITKRRYDNATALKPHVRLATQKTREYSMTTLDMNTLEEEIFLTATGCESTPGNAEIYQFDFEKLREKLHHLARSDNRVDRVRRLAIMASAKAINTCFRRGYVVSKTKFRWIAAVASPIPLLDEVPAFFGREETRQAFGIHDCSTLKNKINNTRNDLEIYLTRQDIKIPKDVLQSGYFGYLVPDNATAPSNDHASSRSNAARQCDITNPSGANVARGGVFAAGAAGKLAGGIVRTAIPNAARAVRGLSIATMVVGVALTQIFAIRSYYSSGKRMDEHLHLLCNDLQIVFLYFIDHLCATLPPNNNR